MKTRILFDATILAEGLRQTSNRSGIFWAAYQIFREFDRREDVEMGVYSSPSMVDEVNMFLDEYFPGRGYKALNRERSCFLGGVKRFVDKHKDLEQNKRGLRKKFWVACGMFAKIARVLWDKYVGSAKTAALADGFDAFFSPVYLAPRAIRRLSRTPRFTILYDTIPMIYPQFSPFTFLGFSWNFDLIKGLRPDDCTFPISICSKNDFLRFSKGMDGDKATVIPLAADEKFRRIDAPDQVAAAKRKYGIPEDKRYMLSLCTIEPRKNLGLALEAFGAFLDSTGADDIVFVLAGGHWGRFEGKWAATLQKLAKYSGRIIHAGYIDDCDLAALYSGAEMFVYPSLYEGFGLPPLEAMQCGTPVITSNVSSLPEVVGDAAIAIDPRDAGALSAAMARLYGDAALRREYSVRGLERARTFSWSRTADVILEKISSELEIRKQANQERKEK